MGNASDSNLDRSILGLVSSDDDVTMKPSGTSDPRRRQQTQDTVYIRYKALHVVYLANGEGE